MDKWKMVPVEPTEEMIYAIATRARCGDSGSDIWAEALAWAPAPAFDEAAERTAFESDYVFRQKRDEHGVRYADPVIEQRWQGYLACAKRKAGGDL